VKTVNGKVVRHSLA